MASFSVVSNIASVNAQANLTVSSTGLNKALTRLSSGFRINTSGDDAAGLAIANNYRSEQAILTQGIRNANDGLSTLNIKDGALNNVSLLLDRLATLASQASSSAGGDARIETDFALLFLDRFDEPEAERRLQLVVKADPQWAPAYAGLAWAAADVSAVRRDGPSPAPSTSPSTQTSIRNDFSWSGPDASTSR